MADLVNTQTVVEALVEAAADLKVTQVAVEALVDTAGEARMTQFGLVIFRSAKQISTTGSGIVVSVNI